MNWQARNIVVVALTVSLLLLPMASEAKEKRGARLWIEKTDGALVEGELLKVSGETLFLFDSASGQGSQVSLSEVGRLDVRRKRSALTGMAIGLAASLVASRVVAAIAINDDPSEESMAFIFLSLYSAPVGMLFGGLASGLRKPYRQMIVGGFQDDDRDAILAELRSLSREGRNDASGE